MKHLMIVLLFIANTAHAKESMEIMTGGLTYHVVTFGAPEYLNANKLSADGNLIANPVIGFMRTSSNNDTFISYGAFTGENSIGKPMVGGLTEIGWERHNFQFGVAFGGYLQNDNDFRKLQYTTATSSSNQLIVTRESSTVQYEPFRAEEVGGIGFVPIAGLVLNYKIPISKKMFLKINTIISPIIVNGTIGVGFDF